MPTGLHGGSSQGDSESFMCIQEVSEGFRGVPCGLWEVPFHYIPVSVSGFQERPRRFQGVPGAFHEVSRVFSGFSGSQGRSKGFTGGFRNVSGMFL